MIDDKEPFNPLKNVEPTPEPAGVESYPASSCSGSCYLLIGGDEFKRIFDGATVTKDIQPADHRSILRVQISRQKKWRQWKALTKFRESEFLSTIRRKHEHKDRHE